MKFLKVKILSDKDVQDVGEENDTILLNIDHIVSVKPINMVLESNFVKGYWIRMTNGKKYRALDLPSELTDLLK